MSFKWKTILGIAAIEIVFLSFLVWQAARYIQDLGEADIEKRASDTVSLASTVLRDSLIAYDLATIEEQINQIAALDGVTYVELDGHGKRLAASYEDNAVVSGPDTRIEAVSDGVYDVVYPLQVAGQDLGTLRIGFSVRDLYALTARMQTRLYAIAAAELLLVALCSWLLARYLTKRILFLREASQKLHAGQPVPVIPTEGEDEIAATIDAFNQMSSELVKREQSLNVVNDELTKSNERLLEQEREMLSLFNSAPDSIAVLHAKGTVLFANRQLLGLLGTDDISLVDGRLSDFLSNPEDNRVTGILAGEEGNVRGHACTIENSSGEEFFVEISTSVFRSGESIRTILIIRDKTHERKLQDQANLQERLKANLVDFSLDAIVTITGDGKVIDFSQSAESIFGWRKNEIIGQTMSEFLIPRELRDAHEKGMRHFLNTGEGPLIGKRVETQARRKGGHSFPVELALTAIWVGDQVFVTAAIRDITERKQREDELLEAKTDAEEASKAKSRFLSFMSHEIRSPMNAVLGSLALIKERGKLQESEQYYLDLARESGNALLKVVNEVLDFSKIEAGRVEFTTSPCSLSGLIEGVQSSILAKGIKSEVGMFYEPVEELPRVIVVDRDHLRQVLTILLDNAYKFTDKGEVRVTVDSVHLEEKAGQGRLRVSVKDTGPGIPPELVDTVFSEFEQTDAIRDSGFGGTGLGLAIAKRLVAGMGGTIGVKSEVGVGSSFSVEIPFELPGVDEQQRGVANSVVEPLPDTNGGGASPETRSQLRILLVDDVEANLIIGSELLKNRGYVVDLARNGAEAVEMASLTEYSVILMDMRMPILNGLEATQKIRNSGGKNTATPIIALTANAEKSEIERCLEGGMNGFVSKPFDIERLHQTIEDRLAESSKGETSMNREEELGREPEVLSEAVLGQLTKDTSVESLPMMISVFINEIRKRIEGIDSAAKSHDELEIREQAHALKSCSGTFGGLRLQAAAGQLESLASRSNACENPELISQVLKVAEETLVTYSEFRESLQASSGSTNPSVH